MTLFSYGFRPEAIDPPSIDQRLCWMSASGQKRTFEHSAANVRRSRLVLIEDESDFVLDGHVLTAVSRQVVLNGEPGNFAFDADVHGRGMLRHVRIVEGADVDPQPFLCDPLPLVILSASAASDLDLPDSSSQSPYCRQTTPASELATFARGRRHADHNAGCWISAILGHSVPGNNLRWSGDDA